MKAASVAEKRAWVAVGGSPYFESRLCGGKQFRVADLAGADFESRLGGGKLIYERDMGGTVFESRLCGGKQEVCHERVIF